MGLIESLLLGGYVYTTGVFLYFRRRIDTLVGNHIQSLEARIAELEKPRDG